MQGLPKPYGRPCLPRKAAVPLDHMESHQDHGQEAAENSDMNDPPGHVLISLGGGNMTYRRYQYWRPVAAYAAR